MATQPRPQLDPEEYLALEREADHKSEYMDGEAVAMAGASFAHNLIVANVVGALGAPPGAAVRRRALGPQGAGNVQVVLPGRHRGLR